MGVQGDCGEPLKLYAALWIQFPSFPFIFDKEGVQGFLWLSQESHSFKKGKKFHMNKASPSMTQPFVFNYLLYPPWVKQPV